MPVLIAGCTWRIVLIWTTNLHHLGNDDYTQTGNLFRLGSAVAATRMRIGNTFLA